MHTHSSLTQCERNGKETNKQCHLRIVPFLMQISVEALSSGGNPVHVLSLIQRNDIHSIFTCMASVSSTSITAATVASGRFMHGLCLGEHIY